MTERNPDPLLALAIEMGGELGRLERTLLGLMVEQEHRIIALEARLEILEASAAREAAPIGSLKLVGGRDIASDDGPAAA